MDPFDQMISATIDNKPNDFQTAFNAAMLAKIKDVVDVKRTEIAQNYLNDQQDQEDTEQEDTEQEEEETDEDSQTAT